MKNKWFTLDNWSKGFLTTFLIGGVGFLFNYILENYTQFMFFYAFGILGIVFLPIIYSLIIKKIYGVKK